MTKNIYFDFENNIGNFIYSDHINFKLTV